MSVVPSERAAGCPAPAVCLSQPNDSRWLSCSWSRLKTLSVQSSGAEEGIPFLLELFGTRCRFGQLLPDLAADQFPNVREVMLHFAPLESELPAQRFVGRLLPLGRKVVRLEDAEFDFLS